MSAVTASLCLTLLFFGIFMFVSADQKNITAESGQNITLTCRAPNNNIIVVEWSRADLGDKHVLSYRDGHFVPGDQHPSFKNRVDLQDRQMKDGDVSLIVQNVNINDTGIYKCCTVGGETDSCDSINIIYLHVIPPGQTGGHTEDGGKEAESVGLIVGLTVPALLLFTGVVGFLIYRKHKQQQSQDSYQPPVELQPV
ncbi:hypothetical protein ACER0C_002158 [Sarotherodon galilaeus]